MRTSLETSLRMFRRSEAAIFEELLGVFDAQLVAAYP